MTIVVNPDDNGGTASPLREYTPNMVRSGIHKIEICRVMFSFSPLLQVDRATAMCLGFWGELVACQPVSVEVGRSRIR